MADRVEVNDYARYNLINPILRMDHMTRDELSGLLSQAFATFYAGQMRRMGAMPRHKREYLTRVSRLLREESYLSEEVAASMRAAAGQGTSAHERLKAPVEVVAP
jgi:hypothetical protein